MRVKHRRLATTQQHQVFRRQQQVAYMFSTQPLY